MCNDYDLGDEFLIEISPGFYFDPDSHESVGSPDGPSEFTFGEHMVEEEDWPPADDRDVDWDDGLEGQEWDPDD